MKKLKNIWSKINKKAFELNVTTLIILIIAILVLIVVGVLIKNNTGEGTNLINTIFGR